MSTNQITRTGKAALQAVVPAVPERSRGSRTAETGLRRSAWVNFDKLATSIRRFVASVSEKLRPSGFVYRLRQETCSQSLDVECLDCNQAEAIYDPARQLVMKIGALIRNVSVRFSKNAYGFTSTITALLASEYASLATPQMCGCFAAMVRVIDYLPVGHHGEAGQADINANRGHILRKNMLVSFDHEYDKPFGTRAFDIDGSYRSIHWSVQFEFYMPDALNTKFPGTEQCPPVMWAREGDAVVSFVRLEARKSRFLSSLDATKEPSDVDLDSTQDILATTMVLESQASGSPHWLDLCGLRVIGESFAAGLPCTDPLLQGSVVKRTRFSEFCFHKLCLRLRRIEPVLKAYVHVISGGYSAICGILSVSHADSFQFALVRAVASASTLARPVLSYHYFTEAST